MNAAATAARTVYGLYRSLDEGRQLTRARTVCDAMQGAVLGSFVPGEWLVDGGAKASCRECGVEFLHATRGSPLIN